MTDGTVVVVDAAAHEPRRATGDGAGPELVTRLLELLVTFIGAPLTVVLVSDAWPDENFDGLNARAEEKK